MEKTFTYYSLSACYDGKLLGLEVTKKISDVQKEAQHRGIFYTEDLVKHWDSQGRALKKYRYFLISQNERIF